MKRLRREHDCPQARQDPARLGRALSRQLMAFAQSSCDSAWTDGARDNVNEDHSTGSGRAQRPAGWPGRRVYRSGCRARVGDLGAPGHNQAQRWLLRNVQAGKAAEIVVLVHSARSMNEPPGSMMRRTSMDCASSPQAIVIAASRDRAARDLGSCPGSANTTCHINWLPRLFPLGPHR